MHTPGHTPNDALLLGPPSCSCTAGTVLLGWEFVHTSCSRLPLDGVNGIPPECVRAEPDADATSAYSKELPGAIHKSLGPLRRGIGGGAAGIDRMRVWSG